MDEGRITRSRRMDVADGAENSKKLRLSSEPVNPEAEGMASSPPPGERTPPEVINPMMVPVILTKFFELCDLSYFPQFRLVSKQWYDISLTRWRNKKTLVLNAGGKETNSESNGNLEWKDVSILYDGENDWRKLQSKPYKNYRLHKVNFDTDDSDDDEDCGSVASRTRYKSQAKRARDTWSTDVTSMKTFWGKIGPSMRHLELVGSKVSCVNSLKKAIFESTPNLEGLSMTDLEWDGKVSSPADFGGGESRDNEMELLQSNLTFLEVKSVSRNGKKMQMLPVTWWELFQHFPNVEKLVVGLMGNGSDNDGDELELHQLINTLELMEKKKTPIKSLDIRSLARCLVTPDLAIRLFQNEQFKLENVELAAFLYEDESAHCHFPAALLHHRATLKSLTLKLISFPENAPIDDRLHFSRQLFPSSLTKLCFEECVFKDLHFLLEVPNLRVLEIRDAHNLEQVVKDTEPSLFQRFVLNQLVELTISSVDWNVFPLPPNIMFTLVRLMPNVMRYTGQLSKGALRIICRSWKNLRYLCIPNLKVEDDTTAGFLADKENQLPNLTNLKYLHHLILYDCRNLSDESIYNGFLKMPHLHSLNLIFSEKVSIEAFEMLARRFSGSCLTRGLQ